MTIYRRSPRALASTLSSLRDAWAPETLLAEVQRAWQGAVGAAIAAEATPDAERAGVLSVRCSAAVWAHELELMGPTIVARLNRDLRRGQITRLRCSAGG